MPDQLQHTVIGTAGHIDHGKTALIKALTGVDVDTLAEEKRRGITIELGFAFLNVAGWEKEILFIDVPGHEKLIKTMVAGASNLDAALLVVAADEGINVQTLEHFEILQLLGIERGVVALTKTDLVDDERIQAVTGDVRSMAAGTFLEGAPVVPVSAVTGYGIDDLKKTLVDVADAVRARGDSGIFRMPIDRVFTIRGFGAVIAGTILSGEVKIGDKLEILPDGLVARVRGIQVHAYSLDSSGLGKRTAINLQDVRKEQLRRGQSACAVGSVKPTTRIDTRLQVLKSYGSELKNRTRVRLHVGTDEVMARLIILESSSIGPGQDCLAQFVLESPTIALPKDRFVIRSFSPINTIGGGIVLDSQARAHKRFDESTLDSLGKSEGSLVHAVSETLLKSDVVPLSIKEVGSRLGEHESDISAVFESLTGMGDIVRVYPISDSSAHDPADLYLHNDCFTHLADDLVGIIKQYYSKNPYRLLMPLSDLQSRFSKLADKRVYDAVIERLSSDGVLIVKKTRIGLADRKIEWRSGESEIADRIEKIYASAGYTTPPEEDVQQELRLRTQDFSNIMTALIEQRRLVRLGERVTYHTKHMRSIKDAVIAHIREHGGITAAELRDKIGVTRKYAIAVLEYLDNAQVTKRLGDKRVLK